MLSIFVQFLLMIILITCLETFRFIVTPGSTQISITQSILVSVLMFIISMIISTPTMYFAQYDIKINYETRKKVAFCHQVKRISANTKMKVIFKEWEGLSSIIYSIVTALIHFLVPAIVVCILYLKIFWKINRDISNRFL